MRRKWVLAFLAFASVLALLYWRLHQPADASAQVIRLACKNLLSDCGDAQTQIRFSHIPTPMQPFQIDIIDQQAQAITLSFEMRDMPMGINRYRMTQHANHWQAQVMLPVCIQGRSDWLMLIQRQLGQVTHVAKIEFTAQGRDE